MYYEEITENIPKYYQEISFCNKTSTCRYIIHLVFCSLIYVFSVECVKDFRPCFHGTFWRQFADHHCSVSSQFLIIENTSKILNMDGKSCHGLKMPEPRSWMVGSAYPLLRVSDHLDLPPQEREQERREGRESVEDEPWWLRCSF